jgi:uroporphyrinogen decarboxylase
MKLVLESLKGNRTDKVPIWYMRQAGRYLPEYLELRKNKTFEDMVQNPDIACEITLQPIKRFDLDAAIIFSDILVPIYSLHRGLIIKPSQGPIIENPIRNENDIDKLQQVTPKEDFPYLGESIKKVKQSLTKNTTLIGFSGAPYTIASYLIEGKSTRDGLKTKAFAYRHPESYKKLLNFISDMLILQLEEEINAGAEVIQIFDSWANTLSPMQYQKMALPYTQKILQSKPLQDIPKIHFALGSGHLLDSFTQTGANCLSIDVSSEMSNVMGKIPEDIGIQGNFDPAILFTNPKIVEKETLDLLEKVKDKKRYIFNLGRGIDKDTPLENVSAMILTVKSYKG